MSAPRPHQRVGRFDEMQADEAKALLEAMDSMSAPRKIWADMDLHDVHGRAVGGDWWNAPSTGILYHHDDVVRELVAALEECRDELDAYSRQEYPGDHPVHERYRQRDFEANPARIALAKIAQEG